MGPDQVRQMILEGMPGARVEVKSQDNTHFEAVVVSSDFADIRTLQRHQMVYRTLGRYMGNEVHALSLRTFTPDEWSRRAGT